jgi:uncharacterized protein YndB with AHSA1/START domain
MELSKMILDIEQHIDVKRGITDVYEGVLLELTDKMCYPDGRSYDMRLERKPGGRWFRDFPNDTGHLWGIVQTIKPPTLLEITGQMFMSYPVANHLSFKLVETDGVTRVTLRHRALGLIPEEDGKGVGQGWGELLEGIKKNLES